MIENRNITIGSIVILKENEDKKIMVISKNVTNLNNNINYDYLGCIYPYGYMGDDFNIFFIKE